MSAAPFTRFKPAFRPVIHWCLRQGLRLRARPCEFGPQPIIVLVLAPHPDDEAFGCGGTIANLCAEGKRVHVVFLTDGDSSHPSHPTMSPINLAATRQTEAIASTRALGIDPANVQFLHLPDGRLSHLTEGEIADAVMRLSSVLTAIAPTTLFAPYRYDGSSEHEAAFRLLQASLSNSKLTPRLLEFPIWSWWSPVLLLRGLLRVRRVLRVSLNQYAATKATAIACHHSQIEPVAPWTQPVLSSAFVRYFLSSEEFFFEI